MSYLQICINHSKLDEKYSLDQPFSAISEDHKPIELSNVVKLL